MAWGFLSKLFVSQKAVEDVTETGKKIAGGIVDGIDALFLTEEERISYGQEGAKIVLSFWEMVAKENTEQSKARRALAMLTLKSFFYIIFLAITCRIVGTFIKPMIEVSTFIIKIALSGIVGGLVISIGTIYFGPHQLSKIVDFKKKD